MFFRKKQPSLPDMLKEIRETPRGKNPRIDAFRDYADGADRLREKDKPKGKKG